jgi:light-regulated signal transduction histidine kinase (bacteriophytochrome)
MRRVPVDLSEMARGIARAFAEETPTRCVDWIIAQGLAAEGDPALLRVVLENLLGNAWKYTTGKPRASIEFAITDTGESPEFFVRDDGAGFDPAHAAKLFQPFQRLHRPDEFDGHGIGLATVLRIVHRHGGDVRAEGSPGKGATFYFRLRRGVR